MNMEEFTERVVQAGVIPPLVELLRGKMTWVEQRVVVSELVHLATYDSTFPIVASHEEVLELSMQLALSSNLWNGINKSCEGCRETCISCQSDPLSPP